MNSRLFNVISIMFGVVVLGVGLNAYRLAGMLNYRAPEETRLPSAKTYTHLVAEGLSMQSGTLPGVDLVRFDSCRIEKQHRGGISFGAFNVLVIEDLELVLPPEKTDVESGSGHQSAHSGNAEKAVKTEVLKLFASYPRFSALEIRGFSVNQMRAGGQHQNVLKAKSAEAGRHKTLELSNCEFISTGGSRISCGKASLSLEPPYQISTGGRTFQVAGLIGSRELLLAQIINQ